MPAGDSRFGETPAGFLETYRTYTYAVTSKPSRKSQ
jgi:hypothetical protein